MRSKRTVKKKGNNVITSLFGTGRDIGINQITTNNMYWASFGIEIYNIVTTSPIEMAIGLLGIKLGITNKIVLALIVAFLIA